MGLLICVPETEALNASKLHERISDICIEVKLIDGQTRLIPQPGKLMALLEILNEGRIDYHFEHSNHNETSHHKELILCRTLLQVRYFVSRKSVLVSV